MDVVQSYSKLVSIYSPIDVYVIYLSQRQLLDKGNILELAISGVITVLV